MNSNFSVTRFLDEHLESGKKNKKWVNQGDNEVTDNEEKRSKAE